MNCKELMKELKVQNITFNRKSLFKYHTEYCPSPTSCQYSAELCFYAHKEENLRKYTDSLPRVLLDIIAMQIGNPYYKHKLCHFFYRGVCKLGEKCLFAHGTIELPENLRYLAEEKEIEWENNLEYEDKGGIVSAPIAAIMKGSIPVSPPLKACEGKEAWRRGPGPGSGPGCNSNSNKSRSENSHKLIGDGSKRGDVNMDNMNIGEKWGDNSNIYTNLEVFKNMDTEGSRIGCVLENMDEEAYSAMISAFGRFNYLGAAYMSGHIGDQQDDNLPTLIRNNLKKAINLSESMKKIAHGMGMHLLLDPFNPNSPNSPNLPNPPNLHQLGNMGNENSDSSEGDRDPSVFNVLRGEEKLSETAQRMIRAKPFEPKKWLGGIRDNIHRDREEGQENKSPPSINYWGGREEKIRCMSEVKEMEKLLLGDAPLSPSLQRFMFPGELQGAQNALFHSHSPSLSTTHPNINLLQKKQRVQKVHKELGGSHPPVSRFFPSGGGNETHMHKLSNPRPPSAITSLLRRERGRRLPAFANILHWAARPSIASTPDNKLVNGKIYE